MPKISSKHAGGRPSEYESKHSAFAVSYLTMFRELGDAVPTIEGLCDELKIGKQTAYRWAEANEEFRDALERIKSKQGRMLQAEGLKGKFAPVITKLMLSANHDMREKTDNEQRISGGLSLGKLLDAASE